MHPDEPTLVLVVVFPQQCHAFLPVPACQGCSGSCCENIPGFLVSSICDLHHMYLSLWFLQLVLSFCSVHFCLCRIINQHLHTAGLDTIFVQIYMDVLPGVPGVSKNQNLFLKIKLLSFCPRITPKRHKLRKIVKIEKKCQKNLVFLEYFKYSSIWGQY